eukprot:COSAG01_NODE_2781_length_7087_cov_36.916428_8_plen_95_part_00
MWTGAPEFGELNFVRFARRFNHAARAPSGDRPAVRPILRVDLGSIDSQAPADQQPKFCMHDRSSAARVAVAFSRQLPAAAPKDSLTQITQQLRT